MNSAKHLTDFGLKLVNNLTLTFHKGNTCADWFVNDAICQAMGFHWLNAYHSRLQSLLVDDLIGVVVLYLYSM